MHLSLWKKVLLPLQFSELPIICFIAWHSLLWPLPIPFPGSAATSVRMREEAMLGGFVFLPGNGSHQTTKAATLCSIFVP